MRQIATAMEGLVAGNVDPLSQVTGASIDSRTTRSRELFLALPGSHCHGAAHASAALAAGAAAIVIAY